MTDTVEIIIVGAGVVGLAVARALTLHGHEVIVLERHRLPGQETSSRNSGVIHSGLYYSTNSLKARLCVQGRDQLYGYCEERGLAHSRCGKIIVAQEAQIASLQALQNNALANAVTDLAWLSPEDVGELEPLVRCAGGLFSPSTGVIDVHEYMTSLQGDLESQGGSMVFDTELIAARPLGDGMLASIRSGTEKLDIACRWLINSAGLHALPLLARIAGYSRERTLKAYYAKGNYFSCQGMRPFRHLVYPMPNEAGLGIHATLDLDGTTRFGPDVEWVDSTDDYKVRTERSIGFYSAIREYWPTLPDGALQPAYAGIRPKLAGPGGKSADFTIEGPNQHGIGGLINLLGIESPGLTASLAIADMIATELTQ